MPNLAVKHLIADGTAEESREPWDGQGANLPHVSCGKLCEVGRFLHQSRPAPEVV